MINKETNFVRASTIDNAWREVMWLCVENGWDYVILKGSYEGQIRKQLPFVTIVIDIPWKRPLAPILPPGIPAPTTEAKIEQYFTRYIMSDQKDPKEEYTYGFYIIKQYDRIIDLLISSQGNTNQATISIGDIDTTFLPDPPCLRHVSFKVVEGKLNMCVYFRSWDLFSGLPENLGGLQLLKELVLDTIQDKFSVSDGQIIAFSDGLHIYEQYFDIVDVLNIDKIKVSQEALFDKKKFIQEFGV